MVQCKYRTEGGSHYGKCTMTNITVIKSLKTGEISIGIDGGSVKYEKMIVCAMLCILLVFSLSACGGNVNEVNTHSLEF